MKGGCNSTSIRRPADLQEWHTLRSTLLIAQAGWQMLASITLAVTDI